MAIALVANDSAQSTNSNGFTSGSIDTTGANFLIVHLSTNGTGGSISDSKSNTWVPLTESGGGAFAARQSRLFYVENATVGSGHTFTVTGTAIFPSIEYAAFSGVATSTSFDVENKNANNFTTTISTGSVTPSVNDELVVTGISFDDNTGVAIDSGFTISDTEQLGGGVAIGGALAYLIQTTATAKNPTWSWTNSTFENATTIACFKAAAAATKAIPIFQRKLRFLTRGF